MKQRQKPKIIIGKIEYKKHDYSAIGGNVWQQYDYTQYNDWTDEASNDKSSYGNDSVKKYGGFYIARYEAGFPDYDTSKFNGNTFPYMTSSEEEIYKKNEQAILENKKPLSKANVFSWNFISQQNALTVAGSMYKDSKDIKNNDVGVTSYLVDGTAWDTVTSWIENDGVNVAISTSYGNYMDNGSIYTGWYAEHVSSSQRQEKTGGVLGMLYAAQFKKGRSNKTLWGGVSRRQMD